MRIRMSKTFKVHLDGPDLTKGTFTSFGVEYEVKKDAYGEDEQLLKYLLADPQNKRSDFESFGEIDWAKVWDYMQMTHDVVGLGTPYVMRQGIRSLMLSRIKDPKVRRAVRDTLPPDPWARRHAARQGRRAA